MPQLFPLLLICATMAQEPAAEVEAPVLIVTGTRQPKPLIDLSRSVVRVDPDAHAPTAADLTEVLQDLPGLHMQRTNRGAGSPFIRGQVGPQNLVIADGLPHNLSTFRTGPNQYLNLLEPLGDHVEVLRGPSSVLYGTGAMGGVVQLTPTTVQDGRQTWVTLRTASADGTAGGTLRTDLGSERGWLRLGLTATDRVALRDGAGDWVPLSDFARQGWLLRAGKELGGGHSLSATTRGVRIDGAGRTDAMAEGELRRYDNADTLSSAQWRLDRQRLSLRTTAGWHHWAERQDRSACETNGETLLDRSGCLDGTAVTGRSERSDRVGAALVSTSAALDLDTVQLVFGGEGQLERVQSERRDQEPGADWVDASRGNFSPGSRYATGGLFAHAETGLLALGPGQLQLRGGARLAHFAAHAEGVPLPDEPEGVVDDAFTGLIGSTGLSWVASDTHVWVGLHQGFRAPNLEESTLFGPEESRFSVPNGELRPERSDTVEVGARHRTQRVQATAVVWASRTRNALDDAPTTWQGVSETEAGLAYSHRTNVDGARYVGAELDARVDLGWLAPEGHLAWTQGSVLDGSSSSPARRVPPLHGAARLWLQPQGRPWTAALRVDGARPQRRLHPGDTSDLRICASESEHSTTFADLGQDCPGTPGWVTIGLSARTEIAPGLSASIDLLNLTDRAYKTHGSGIMEPGVDARAALHGTWSRP